MDANNKAVERAVASCLPCQASVEERQRDPLKPTKALTEPWVKLYADHWGPTREHKHVLVVIDGLTRYPEVQVVSGTSGEDNIRAFSEIFSRHGIPQQLCTDNRAPFNGKDSHILQTYFRNLGIQHTPNRSAEDPEATGAVESFMKHIKKVFHMVHTMVKYLYHKLTDHLMVYRAPHTHVPTQELQMQYKFQLI